MKGIHKGEKSENRELYKAILKLKNINECAIFFRDLCTIEEITEMSKRWEAAGLINQEKLSYREIATKTGLSTTTVARVAFWLHHGRGGYQLILKRK